MIYDLSATSQSIDIEILDDSGLPVTSLVAATFPTLTYSLAGANADVSFPALSDLAALTTAYSSGGVKERGDGVYRLDLPNGIFATAGQVRIRGEATGKHVVCPWLEIAPSVASVVGDLGGSVVGDVQGKVLGGGASALSGTGVRAVDNSGNAIAPASTALSNVQWTNTRAAYLDNLNVGGAVASQADVAAINLSATKHLTLSSVQQYERPESGSTSYPIECRTYDAETSALVDADSTPTLTATGQTSGDLSANLSAATHVSTGIYRWTYSVANDATNEPLRFDVSATISSSTFTLAHFSQVVDDVSVTWNATNASQLAALYNKAPAGNIADEALLEAAIALTQQAGSAVTLPSIPTNWIDAAGIAASALNGKGDWSVAGDAMTLANGAITTAAVADGAITDAKFTVPTEPSGLASGVLSQLNQLWRRFVGNKITQTSTQIEMYKSDGTTVVVTQAVSDDGTTQTQGAGS